MKKINVCILFLIVSFFQSCLIPSIHPLYDAHTKTVYPLLEGKWHSNVDDGETWNFELDGDQYYLTYNDGHEAYFEITLVKLGTDYFLDFFPADIERAWNVQYEGTKPDHQNSIQRDDEMNELLAGHLLPIHTFSKIEIEKDEVRIWMFDLEWLEKLIKTKKLRIKHEKLDDYSLITAPTQELQKFVIKYANLEDAYIDYDSPLTLRRQP